MYAEISAAIQSAKALGELLKAAHGLANYNEHVAAVSEIYTKLMDVTAVAIASQEKESLLANRVSELENELREAKHLETDLERYQLIRLSFGTYAYSMKPGMEQGEPPHYLCAACVKKRQPSIMQPSAREAFLRCSFCHDEIQVSHLPSGKMLADYDPYDPKRS